MLQKTRAIVLRQIKYSESSIIAVLYTEKFGRLSIIAKGARKKKAKIPAKFFQPLYLHQVEVYFHEKRDLHNIKEINPYIKFTSIPFDIKKTSIAIFLSEVLYRSLHEQATNPELFEFLSHGIQLLDLTHHATGNFNIVFLLQLSKYLGFSPQISPEYNNKGYFDIKNGYFINQIPSHDFFLSQTDSAILFEYLQYNLQNLPENNLFPQQKRRKLLRKILSFYQFHIEETGKINSQTILQELFD